MKRFVALCCAAAVAMALGVRDVSAAEPAEVIPAAASDAVLPACCGAYGYGYYGPALGGYYADPWAGWAGYYWGSPAYWGAGYLWAPDTYYYSIGFLHTNYTPISPIAYPVYAYPPSYYGWYGGYYAYGPMYPYAGYPWGGYGYAGPVYLGW